MGLKNAIITLCLIFFIQGSAVAELKTYVMPESIKNEVENIGILVSGASDEGYKDARDSSNTYRLNSKFVNPFKSHKRGLFNLERLKRIEVWDDGRDLKSFGRIIPDLNTRLYFIFSDPLKKLGYETVYLNSEDFMKEYYNNKTISETIDMVKNNRPDIDALWFIFYSEERSMVYSNVTEFGYFLFNNSLMYKISDNTQLYRDHISAGVFDLPQGNQRVVDVYKLFKTKIKESIMKNIPTRTDETAGEGIVKTGIPETQ